MSRTGEWIQLLGGRKFWPLNPDVEDVYIEDIAHALGNMCRFAGHTSEFYSVAQHSTLVSYWCPPEHALCGLLHDAAEAYLVDLPRLLKHPDPDTPFAAEFRRVEDRILCAIFDRFGLPWNRVKEVEYADMWMLAAEARDLLGDPEWVAEYRARVRPPLPKVPAIRPLPPREAEQEFLLRFYQLMLQQKTL